VANVTIIFSGHDQYGVQYCGFSMFAGKASIKFANRKCICKFIIYFVLRNYDDALTAYERIRK